MSPFEQLSYLYNQLLNVADEIKSMLELEEYNEVITMLQHKSSLLEKLDVIKKNTKFTDEETIELKKIEEVLVQKEDYNIEFLTKAHSLVAAELKSNNKKIKVGTAYSVKSENPNGSMIDCSE